ncbi:hypothetical protein CGK42_24345, partial [Vibrio parahaemolyticus]|uniref:hypothetical protein n=1 Tax=Vibrio parahaemolyticus TaxID=670 RepID=UPI0011214838
MFIAINKIASEVLVMADDRGIPFPLLKNSSGEWCKKLPEVGTILDTFTPVDGEHLSNLYFTEAFEEYQKK